MFTRRGVLAVAIVLSLSAGLGAQTPQADEAVWTTFMAWLKASPPEPGNPVIRYSDSLRAARTPEADVRRQAQVVMRMIMSGRSDWVEPVYDKTFSGSRALTGDPPTDGFASEPSAVVIETVKGRPPGVALDAGMGQGRNAVFLARQGWTVSGFDVSAEAVRSVRANAAAAGVRINAVKASYADFDFGTAKWDLIVLTFAWAPMTDAAFVDRLRTSLRPDGRIVFEHFIEDGQNPRPPAMYVLKPGQLRDLLRGFRFDRYDELFDTGDWGGPGMHLVRAVAVRP